MNNFKEQFLAHLRLYVKKNQECIEAAKAYDAKLEARIQSVAEGRDIPDEHEALANMCVHMTTCEKSRHNTGMTLLILARRLTETDLKDLGVKL